MTYTYHLIYSCYNNSMQLLLNEKRISQNSSLWRFMGEPFGKWCRQMPGLLARELGEDFYLVYTGREEEAEVLETLARQENRCLGFRYEKPVLVISLAERMKELDQIVQNVGFPVYQRSIPVVFLGTPEILEIYKNQIAGLKIQNSFCKVENRILDETRRLETGFREFGIFLCDTVEQAKQKAESPDFAENGVFIGMGDQDSFVTASQNYVFSFQKGNFARCVTKVLSLFCFPSFLESTIIELSKQERKLPDRKTYENLLILSAVEPYVQVKAKEQIELGTSVPLQIRTLPVGCKKPELEFQYQIPGIVECTESQVMAKRPGTTRVLVFRKGSIKVIRTLEFTVYTRKMITRLLMEQGEKSCTVGDLFVLRCDYFPEDADNVDIISWESSNQEVAQVEAGGSGGWVTVNGIGKCEIICRAGEVSARCRLDCRPFSKMP